MRATVLTAREAEVLRLMASCLSDRQIAARLGLQQHSASNHVARIIHKLGATNRMDAVLKAMRDGMVEIPPRRS